MTEQPLRWRRCLRAQVVDGDRVLLYNERERFMLDSRACALLGQRVDGVRTLDSLVAEADGVSSDELRYAVHHLRQKGYLGELVPEQRGCRNLELLEHLGVQPETAAQWQARGVCVHDVSGRSTGPLLSAIQALGIRVREPDTTDPVVHVVQVGDYLDAGLARFNQQALSTNLCWIPVKPFGVAPMAGPVFRGTSGFCWECLAGRLRSNRPVEQYLQRRGSTEFPLPALPRSTVGVEIMVRLFSLWLTQHLGGGPHRDLEASILSVDLATGATTRHPVERRPQCSACGVPGLASQRMSQPVKLQSRPCPPDAKRRIVEVHETLQRLEHLVSPISGVVSSLSPVNGRHHERRPVFAASWFRSPAHSLPAFDDFHRTSLGRGDDAIQARAGALCEALERYSAGFQGDEPVCRARAEDLGGAAILPPQLLGFSLRQYAEREAYNQKYDGLAQSIPPPYDGSETCWSPVWSLTDQRRRYVPTSLCFYDSASAEERIFCCYDSNGDAAGNCLEEAILQGFLELAERDGVALWWYNRARRPAVDLHSFHDPYIESLLGQYRRADWSVWVLDVTTDLDIPTFVAFGTSRDEEQFSIGFGSHLDARAGVHRALTELNQLWALGEHRSLPLPIQPLRAQQYLYPRPGLAMRTAADYVPSTSSDLRDDVLGCVARARSAGLELLVLDRSRPDVELSVAKVIVPGLRHFWPRFGPGRLYDIPVQLGWLERQLPEEQLNPVPLLL